MAERASKIDNTGNTTLTPQAAKEKMREPINWGNMLTHAILLGGLFIAILPFVWMVMWSLMTNVEVTVGRFVPQQVMLDNYVQAWEKSSFSQYSWNSARIAAIQITGMLIFSVPAAYAFARMRFWGRNVIFAVLLTTLMIPDIVTLIPNFLTVVWLDRVGESLFGPAAGWLNNWPALTVPFMASAFTIFLLRQFFQQIPEDLWDAARIDGAGHLRFLLSVVVPLSRAPLMTVITLTFIGSWNALLWPLLVVSPQAEEWLPVAYGLTAFVQSEAGDEFHLQMAASVITVLPIIVLYFFTQKQFTEGIATTGIRG